MSKLKQCPFCGSRFPFIWSDFNTEIPAFSVLCPDCDVETAEFTTKEKAVTAWNTRANEDTELLD